MVGSPIAERLVAEVRALLSPMSIGIRHDDKGVVVDLVHDDGSVVWPEFAHGPDEVLAILAAEQRYLVEQQGHGSVRGESYVDKARERLRRASQAAN